MAEKEVTIMIGTFYTDLTDPVRKETLGKKTGSRRIAIRFYYPGIEEPGRTGGNCLTKTKAKWLGKAKDFTLYDSRICLYEGIRIKDGTFPLILFNHGYGGFTEQNSDLCQYLAEQNYIVASIGHSCEASETVYTDGTSTLFDRSLYLKMFRPFIPAVIDLFRLRKKELSDEEALKCFDVHQNRYEAFIVQRVPVWAEDDRLALKKVHAMNEDPESFLYHKIDFANGVGMTGHSYGGALAYYHCLYDDEICCGVNIDGGLFGNYADAVNHKPFMQILHKANRNVVSRSRLYHDKPVHYLIFGDTEHNGFTDKKLVSRQRSEVGTSDPVLTMDTLNKLHAAFFERYLKNKDTADSSPLPVTAQIIDTYETL